MALVTGALLWPAVLGVALAVWVPGSAYAMTVPVLLVAAAGLVAVGRDRPGRWWLVAWTAGAALAVVLLLDTGLTLLRGTAIADAGPGVICLVLAGFVTLPLVVVAVPRRWVAVLPAVAVALAVALTAAGLAIDRFDTRYPQPTSLRYVFDGDTGAARWDSDDTAPHDWVRRHAPHPAAPDPDAGALPYGASAAWTGPAVAAPLPAPELTVLETGLGRVRVHLRSPRDADVVTLAADRPVESVTITADGATTTAGPQPPQPGRAWPFRMQFYDPPAEGITVELRIADPAGMRLRVADYTPGLAGMPGFVSRPPELTRTAHHSGDIVVVTCTHRL